MSLFLNAVRQENKKARFNAGGGAWSGCQAEMLLVCRDCLDALQENIRILHYLMVTIGCVD